MPALLTRTSRRSCFERIRFARSRTAASEERSARYEFAFSLPTWLISSSSVASRRSGLRPSRVSSLVPRLSWSIPSLHEVTVGLQHRVDPRVGHGREMRRLSNEPTHPSRQTYHAVLRHLAARAP